MQNPKPPPPWWRRLLTELRPAPRWREVLRRAWSVRLFAASMACQATDVVLSTTGAFSNHYGTSLALKLAGVALGGLGVWLCLVTVLAASYVAFGAQWRPIPDRPLRTPYIGKIA